jgi:uncharacterized protein with von Willebrand factor type A (vWA) domain
MQSQTIVDFCRFLRQSGLECGVHETLGAVEVGRAIDSEGITALRHALRASVCTSKEEWDAFDNLFEAFVGEKPIRKQRQNESRQAQAAFVFLNGFGASSGRELDRDGNAVTGASILERLSKTDLSALSVADQDALGRLAQKLFQRAVTRLSRRLKAGGIRATLDFRRTIHKSIGRGGEIVDFRYKGKKPKKPRLVILLDISGSMNAYSLFLLRFAYALQNQFRQTHTFVFSTQLTEITAELRSREITLALKNLSASSVTWSGGTKIGESLAKFNALHARKLLSRDTLFLILSDGWDTGDPERLATELRRIKQRVRKLIWLNPLLGLEEYRPATRGMAAALPHLDVFAPAHSLESLAQLDRYLCSTNF